jgi:hypothetical protein
MATLETLSRNAAVNGVVDLIDAQAASGTLVCETATDAAVATLTFANTAFGAATGGTATANAIASDTNATGGTIAQVSFYDATGGKILEATAATSGQDFTFSSLVVGSGDTVSVSSCTVTQPAS